MLPALRADRSSARSRNPMRRRAVGAACAALVPLPTGSSGPLALLRVTRARCRRAWGKGDSRRAAPPGRQTRPAFAWAGRPPPSACSQEVGGKAATASAPPAGTVSGGAQSLQRPACRGQQGGARAARPACAAQRTCGHCGMRPAAGTWPPAGWRPPRGAPSSAAAPAAAGPRGCPTCCDRGAQGPLRPKVGLRGQLSALANPPRGLAAPP